MRVTENRPTLKQLLCWCEELQKNDAISWCLAIPTFCPIHRLDTQITASFTDLSVQSSSIVRELSTPPRGGGLIPPTFVRHPSLSPDKPLNISQGVLNITFTVHTFVSQSSTLILHSLCIIKHDRNVLLNGFQWNKCDIIFQLLCVDPQAPTGASPLDPAGDFRPPDPQ